MINVNKTLDEFDGEAFKYLEASFWSDVLNTALKKTNGNQVEASEILGISKVTLIRRCNLHGIDVNEYRKKGFKERKGKHEKHKRWNKMIRSAFSNTSCVSEAAKAINWPRSTLYQRMGIIGFTKEMYKGKRAKA